MEFVLKFLNELIHNEESFSLVLIVLILFFLYIIYHRFFKPKKDSFVKYIRHFLLPFTFISGFVIYFIGYQVGNSHSNPYSIFPNILESIFSTTRLFILGNDLVEIESPFKHNELFHAMFALTASLAAFIFVSVIAQVFFKNWMVRGRIKRMKANENHFFFGINQSSLSLSNSLLEKQNRLVVFVDDLFEHEDQRLYSKLSDEAYVIKRKSFFESINLEKEEGLLQFFQSKKNHANGVEHNDDIFHNLNVLKNKIGIAETHLYFLTDDEDWNIEHAKQALLELQKLELEKPIRIHIGTYSETSDKHFQEWSKLKLKKISVIIHHYATIVSRQLITKYHPVDFVEINPDTAIVKTDFNALILGFGQIGSSVLRKLIEQGQFVGSTFHATIIDKFIHILEGRFEHLYPEIKTNYDLNFVEAEAGHAKFYAAIKTAINKTNYLVISLGNDNLNIHTALEILEIKSIKTNGNIKIFIQLESESHWKETLTEFKDKIYIFGDSNEIYSEENILQSISETRGRLVHSAYNEIIYPNPNNKPFDEISLHEQRSNISVAEHLYAKVRLLGYKNLDDFSNKFTNNNDYIKSLSEIQRLNLSITEHLRWNAFHFIHGWTTIPIEKIAGKEKKEKYKNRKNVRFREHSCLTSWEKLKELEVAIGEDMQKADIVSVENLYNFINHDQDTNNA